MQEEKKEEKSAKLNELLAKLGKKPWKSKFKQPDQPRNVNG